jgi:RNA methyltransferase, TrmH family
VLTSTRNAKVVAAVRLKKRGFRDEDRRFLVEGAQAVGEALADDRLDSLFVASDADPLAVRAARAGVPVDVANGRVMERLTSTVTPQGVVGVAPFVDRSIRELSGPGVVTILDEVRDPGNAGTILRSADAAGALGVVFAGSSVDPYNPKAVRASAGSIFHVPIVRGPATVEAVGSLRDGGFSIVAMDMHGEEDLFETELPASTAFVFGNEAHGLSESALALADRRVRVPHVGRAESLNLAAAATVCLFEWVRRGRAPGAALEGLVAAAAHDVRSPLTAMKGFGYALARRWDDLSEEQRDVMLRGIMHDADRMDTLLRQLVDAARVMSGHFEPFPELVDVEELIGQVADQQARDPEHPPVKWAGPRVTSFVDGGRLKTTILAFVEALVWWGNEGAIEIAAEAGDRSLHVRAARGSKELVPEVLGGLFEPRSPGTGGGSKIGLYVARRVAEAQGGRTWADQRDGRLSLHVELPIVRGAGSAP